MEERGKLVLIEGTDGSGKAKQSNKLSARLYDEGRKIGGTISFPKYNTPTGRIIGQCYLGKKREGEEDGAWFGDPDKVDSRVASLYYAADRLAARDNLMRCIESDDRVFVLDRYVESNMAHQGGKMLDREEREKFWDFIENLEYGLLELPRPNLTIFLYMPAQVSRELKSKQTKDNLDGHESNMGHMKRAENADLELAERCGWSRIDCAPDGTIASLRTQDSIHEEVFSHVKRIL